MKKLSKEDIEEVVNILKEYKMIYGFHFEEGYTGVYELVLTCNFPTKNREINWYNETICISHFELKESLVYKFASKIKHMHTRFIDDMTGVS